MGKEERLREVLEYKDGREIEGEWKEETYATAEKWAKKGKVQYKADSYRIERG